jgi:hypothetical protein
MEVDMEIGRLWQLFCADALQNSGTPQATFRGFANTFSCIEIGKYNFVNFYYPPPPKFSLPIFSKV